eukprot:CAMPEP_0171061172 /NCGR_PEP_ID=MMETSP0766_2-20121228/4264_1 /TAXON_ID=439317 /ORGANISM="Gambierdiscus australes, Strain CAWD 149" /LENGTH=222 /DNA_ID=CAMNT_0011516811 /DNA_START=76 /DNA_END=744 /DNA_ORIENTATION=-
MALCVLLLTLAMGGAQATSAADDHFSMVQRAPERAPPPPRPRPRLPKMPDQAAMRQRIRSAVHEVERQWDNLQGNWAEEGKKLDQRELDQRAESKARAHLKEIQKHQDEKEKAKYWHDKKADASNLAHTYVEGSKRSSESEKVERQTQIKASYKAMEEAELKLDNDMKEADYAERNRIRAEKSIVRDQHLAVRKRRKDEARLRAKLEIEQRERKEAELMGRR